MGIAEKMIESFDWSEQQVASGTGNELASSLRAFINSGDSEEARRLWWNIEGTAVTQNTLYGAAEPTVDALMAALADERPPHVRQWIVELLRFLLVAGSTTDPDLATRCRERARLGTWLLAQHAAVETGTSREAILEVIEILDLERATSLRRWLGEEGATS